MKVLLILIFIFTSCEFPNDPDRSLQTIKNGIIRIGITQDNVQVIESNGHWSGPEVKMIYEFAQSLNSRIQWVHGSESQIMEQLESRELDLGIGGFKQDNPWKKKVGMTKAYDKTKHVIAVASGENALLMALENFISQSGYRK